jgi:3-carboxy-cis,cis-muconate cycloisomerase
VAESRTPRFDLLDVLYGDAPAKAIWSAESTVSRWLEVEAGLARAQARSGLIQQSDAAAISSACRLESIDMGALWDSARTVGYPILGLVRQIAALLPEGPDGRVHYGATTQDIMDSGLALQLTSSCDHLIALTISLGDALAEVASNHRSTTMAARTHGQQAVPTTFGAKMAVYLTQAATILRRQRMVRDQVAVVSLHGAGGTNAAMGPNSSVVRAELAKELALADSLVPWHGDRTRIAEFGAACAMAAAVCARLAREVVDLSRIEIAEVLESGGHHRGASSTMPQKANPIFAESIMGFSIAAQAEGAALTRVIESEHERSSGEWQAEWVLLPQVVAHTAAALSLSGQLVATMHVDSAAMLRNMQLDGGLLMSEAVMIRAAMTLGRERAHDLVYDAVIESRANGGDLQDVLAANLSTLHLDPKLARPIDPQDYTGEAESQCGAAVNAWFAEVAHKEHH